MKTIIAAILLASPMTYAASTVTFSGEGHAPADADYIENTVSISSQCYTSATLAEEANSKLANQVKDIMKKYAQNSQDEVLVSAGRTNRQSVVYDSGRNNVLCKKGWSVTSSLILKMADVSKWASYQDDILKLSDSAELAQTSNQNNSSTKVSMGSPSPQQYPATVEALQIEARKLAYADAVSKLNELVDYCGVNVIEISNVTQGSAPRALAYSDGFERSRASSSGSSISLSFGQMYQHQRMNITWNITGGDATCTALSNTIPN